MLHLIKNLLQQYVDDINSGNCQISYEDQCQILKALTSIYSGSEIMSKQMAADYIGVSRATFDNYVKNGYIPKGEKKDGFKELHWHKSDLDIYLINKKSQA